MKKSAITMRVKCSAIEATAAPAAAALEAVPRLLTSPAASPRVSGKAVMPRSTMTCMASGRRATRPAMRSLRAVSAMNCSPSSPSRMTMVMPNTRGPTMSRTTAPVISPVARRGDSWRCRASHFRSGHSTAANTVAKSSSLPMGMMTAVSSTAAATIRMRKNFGGGRSMP